MAKEIQFKLGGKDYGAAPVKLERKKIYGWTDFVATDRAGEVCDSASDNVKMGWEEVK